MLIPEDIHKSIKELGRIIPCSDITDIKPTQIDNVYYANYKHESKVEEAMLLLLGKECTLTPAVLSEFAKIYSLPTHKYNNDVSQYRRYSKWLEDRNKWIKGFTKYKDNYYMVVYKLFHHYYSRYEFCSACGILRCSSVWCI